jgi:hypothetical protein
MGCSKSLERKNLTDWEELKKKKGGGELHEVENI